MRKRVRKPANPLEWAAAALIAALVLWTAFDLLRLSVLFLKTHWYVAPGIALMAAGVLLFRKEHRTARHRDRSARLAELRLTPPQLDALDPTGFELAIRDLMLRDGFDAEHVGRTSDYGADVLGRAPTGHRLVIQAKHTKTNAKVTSRVIHEISGTATPFHGADIAIVVTNGDFTRDAHDRAATLGIQLINRTRLHRWAHEGHHLTTLIDLRTAPRRTAG
ncbi:restriction endonuclease [Actinocorallia lasiicapitis]